MLLMKKPIVYYIFKIVFLSKKIKGRLTEKE